MKKLLVIALIIVFCFLLGSPIIASPIPPSGVPSGKTIDLKQYSPVGEIEVAELIGLIISAVLGVIGAIALFMFVYGGVLMLTSGGKTDKIQKGKDVLTWAIIGLVVIFGSYVLTNFIISGLTSTILDESENPDQACINLGKTCQVKSHTDCDEDLDDPDLRSCLLRKFPNCEGGKCGGSSNYNYLCCE